MNNSQEEQIVLEISPLIEAEDYIELKYNLSAIMSGLATESCFQVEISENSFANVTYEDGSFNICLVEGNTSTTYSSSSFEDALMFISGEDDAFCKAEDDLNFLAESVEEMRSLVEYYDVSECAREFKSSAYEQLDFLYESLGRILGK